MKKRTRIALMAAVGIVAALVATLMTGNLDGLLQQALAPADAPAPASTDVVATPVEPGPDGGSVTDAEVAERVIPVFDLVRVEPTGDAVIAGQGAPESEVEIVAGSDVIATGKANTSGEWAVVLDTPLPAGAHDIKVRSKTPEGEAIESEQSVAVSVPEGGEGEVLVVLNAPGAPSELLQVPGADAVADGAAAGGDASPGETEVAAAPAATEPTSDPAATEPAAATPEPAATEPAAATSDPAATEPAAATPEPAATEPAAATSEPAATEPGPVDAPAAEDVALAAEPESGIDAPAAPASSPEPATPAVAEEPSAPADAGAAVAQAPASSPSADEAADVIAGATPPEPVDPAGDVDVAAAPPAAQPPAAVPEGATAGDATAADAGTVEAAVPSAAVGGGASAPAVEAPVVARDDMSAAPAATADAGASSEGTAPAATDGGTDVATDAAAAADGAPAPAVEAPATVVAADAPAASEPAADAAAPQEQEVAALVEETPARPPVQVTIEAVELENGTRFFAAGAAEPGSTLRLYVDDRPAGETRAMDTGRWLLDRDLPLEPGDHRVRIDHVAPDGSVVSRAEVPFEILEELVAGPIGVSGSGSVGAGTGIAGEARVGDAQTLIIRRGDNLWRIARRLYGAGVRYSTIYQANDDQIVNPDLIFPGQVFVIPTGDRNWEAAAEGETAVQ